MNTFPIYCECSTTRFFFFFCPIRAPCFFVCFVCRRRTIREASEHAYILYSADRLKPNRSTGFAALTVHCDARARVADIWSPRRVVVTVVIPDILYCTYLGTCSTHEPVRASVRARVSMTPRVNDTHIIAVRDLPSAFPRCCR